jgi:hypothetical protein
LLAWKDWYVDGRQAEQTLRPVSLPNVPTGQGAQTLAVLPGVPLKRPVAHCTHEVEAMVDCVVPSGQGVHAVLPLLGVNEPWGHAEQAVERGDCAR